MGLAASQARFLGITARKSNIEYEGQQVNQQRTALAEEVNALYNKLAAMKLPVVPDTTEFYETKYTFKDNKSNSYAINNYYLNKDGETYTIMATKTSTVSEYISEQIKYGSMPTKTIIDDENNKKAIIDAINNDIGTQYTAEDTLYTFQRDNKTCFYILPKDADEPAADDIVPFYDLGNVTKEESVIIPDAVIKFDSKKGRMESVSATSLDLQTTAVDTERYHDDEGYEAALRDYTMSKEEYDKRVEELNLETKSLQQEDKVLELRLNQIDTEQNELQTELEAVKAVLDKNIENTFKTFS
ncbi:hypothetical protein II906_08115 [bacterium]|nr:hypothetical protein [bacterium]